MCKSYTAERRSISGRVEAKCYAAIAKLRGNLSRLVLS